MRKAQASIEFLLILSIAFVLSIFVVGQFANMSNETIALAVAKESFYEKIAKYDVALQIREIKFNFGCQQPYIGIFTNPQTTGLSAEKESEIIEGVKQDIISSTGYNEVNVLINGTAAC